MLSPPSGTVPLSPLSASRMAVMTAVETRYQPSSLLSLTKGRMSSWLADCRGQLGRCGSNDNILTHRHARLCGPVPPGMNAMFRLGLRRTGAFLRDLPVRVIRRLQFALGTACDDEGKFLIEVTSWVISIGSPSHCRYLRGEICRQMLAAAIGVYPETGR